MKNLKCGLSVLGAVVGLALLGGCSKSEDTQVAPPMPTMTNKPATPAAPTNAPRAGTPAAPTNPPSR